MTRPRSCSPTVPLWVGALGLLARDGVCSPTPGPSSSCRADPTRTNALLADADVVLRGEPPIRRRAHRPADPLRRPRHLLGRSRRHRPRRRRPPPGSPCATSPTTARPRSPTTPPSLVLAVDPPPAALARHDRAGAAGCSPRTSGRSGGSAGAHRRHHRCRPDRSRRRRRGSGRSARPTIAFDPVLDGRATPTCRSSARTSPARPCGRRSSVCASSRPREPARARRGGVRGARSAGVGDRERGARRRSSTSPRWPTRCAAGGSGAAALDVRVNEPPDPADDPLADAPNLLLTPHVAASSASGDRRPPRRGRGRGDRTAALAGRLP